MRTRSMVALLFIVAACAGCVTASIVQPPGGTDGHFRFAPGNDKQAPGVAHYPLRGVPEILEARRRDAYKRMHNACYGTGYSVEVEGPTLVDGRVVAGPAADGGDWYIQFVCTRAEAH